MLRIPTDARWRKTVVNSGQKASEAAVQSLTRILSGEIDIPFCVVVSDGKIIFRDFDWHPKGVTYLRIELPAETEKRLKALSRKVGIDASILASYLLWRDVE